MIDPIILWVGGIVMLLACVLFYFLIAEFFKPQYKTVPRTIPPIRKPVNNNRSQFRNVGSQVIFIKNPPPQKTASTVVSPVSTPLTFSTSQFVSASVKSKMYRLLNGDRAGAVRLVGSIRARNPDKSEQWCWEKAVFDLERDRC